MHGILQEAARRQSVSKAPENLVTHTHFSYNPPCICIRVRCCLGSSNKQRASNIQVLYLNRFEVEVGAPSGSRSQRDQKAIRIIRSLRMQEEDHDGGAVPACSGTADRSGMRGEYNDRSALHSVH